MAKQAAVSQSSTNLFKDLPAKLSASAPRNPKEEPENIPVEPKEFPQGERPEHPAIHDEPPVEITPPTPPEEDPEPEQNDVPASVAGRVQEIDMLKQRAQLMGIKFSNNISVGVLRTKIQNKLDGEREEEEDAEKAPAEAPVQAQAKVPVKSERQIQYDNEMRLVRLRITNMDPKKRELSGEIFTVANRILGAVKKFIPYGEATDNGYHVPYIIYRQLKEREFLNIKTRKDRQGRTIVETSMIREFALEELPPLTQTELNQLAAQQAAAAGMAP